MNRKRLISAIFIPALFASLIAPINDGLAQARMVMSGDPSILGICNDQLLLTGRLGPVTNGLLKYDGKRVSVVGNFSQSGMIPYETWLPSQGPLLSGFAPLRFLLGRGKEALATTCGTSASTKIVLNPLQGGVGSFTIIDGKLITSRINARSIELFRVSSGQATLLGSVPTFRQDSRNKKIGGEVYNTTNALLLTAPHPDTKQPVLWKLTSEGFQLLTTFPELASAGYTFVRVLKDAHQIGGGNLIVKVAARSATGQDENFLYFTDGGDVRKLSGAFNYVLPVQAMNGFLSLTYDPLGWPDNYGCKIGLFRAPDFVMEDVTPEGGLVPGDPAWCVKIVPRATTGASLFFTYGSGQKTLQRFNANTGAVTTLLAYESSFPNYPSVISLHDRLFINLLDGSQRELSYISDGTVEGTRPIKTGNRNLYGVDPRISIMYRGEMYTSGYSGSNPRTGAIIGSGLYKFLLPVGPVVE